MKLTLLHKDPRFGASWKTLLPGDSALFGSGADADFGVSGEGIGDRHFVVEAFKSSAVLKSLADGGTPVLVNGDQVTRHELRDGDVLNVGGARVQVKLEGGATPDPDDVPEAPRVDPAKLAGVVAQEQPTGIVCYYDPQREDQLGDVLDAVWADPPPMLLANFRFAHEPEPEWLRDLPNLLAKVSKEIAVDNSLHLIAVDDLPAPADDTPAGRRDALLELFELLRPSGAASLLLTPEPKDAVLESLKQRCGFVSNSRGLEAFLQDGSPELASDLVASLSAVLIAHEGETDWSLYANAEKAPTPADLGLPGTDRSPAEESPETGDAVAS